MLGINFVPRAPQLYGSGIFQYNRYRNKRHNSCLPLIAKKLSIYRLLSSATVRVRVKNGFSIKNVFFNFFVPPPPCENPWGVCPWGRFFREPQTGCPGGRSCPPCFSNLAPPLVIYDVLLNEPHQPEIFLTLMLGLIAKKKH